VNPPQGAVVVKTSFRDNSALSEELRAEIEHLKAADSDEYEHVLRECAGRPQPPGIHHRKLHEKTLILER
jgi:hypothetical protein